MEASSYVVGSCVAHFAALAVMATSMPPMEVREDEVEDHQEVSAYQIYVESEFGDLPMPGSVDCNHCDTAMGALDAPVTRDRYGVEGPADNPDPHISRWDDGDDVFLHPSPNGGPLSVAIGMQGPPAPWGRDDALGTDAVEAKGGFWGDELGDSSGDEGLGYSPAPSERVSAYGYRCRMP